MKGLLGFLVSLGVFLGGARASQAMGSLRIVINEFSALSSPDWIEIYNQEEEPVDLNGWVIRDETQSNRIDLEGLICPGSFRKFDFSNRLNNGGDEIKLIDNGGNEVDRVVYFSDFVPEHLASQSTGREPNGANFWQVFLLPTPQDEICFFPTITPAPTPTVFSTPTPTPTPTVLPTEPPTPILSPTPSPTPTAAPTPALTPISTPTSIPTSSPQDYDNVFLNEVMANPDEGEEWIELYNGNGFTVDLIDWFLDDLADGGSSPEKFSLIIWPDSYAIITFNRAVFNNSGDEVRLLNYQGEVKDSFSYSETVAGQSWGLVSGKWCLQQASPGEINSHCLENDDAVGSTAVIGSTETVDKKEEKAENLLGVSTGDYQEELINFDFNLGTYSLVNKPTSSQGKCEMVYSLSNKWLPSWPLFFWGFLSLGIGAFRIIKGWFKDYNFG